MKALLPRQELADALGAALTLAGGRTTKPIFSCVKLRTVGEAIEITATDGEAGLHLTVPALRADKPGEAVVAADRMASIVREMPDTEIMLESRERNLKIHGVGGEFQLVTSPPTEFPPVATFEDEPDLAIDGHVLKQLIALTIHAAARETTRYAFQGVLWEKQARRLQLVATDGRRLARAGGSIREGRGGDFDNVVVPTKALAAFERVFQPPKDANEEWLVKAKIAPNQIFLKAPGKVLTSVLVEGNFPDYKRVIPTDGNKRARLNREDFLGAVRRAALLTTDEARSIKLAFGKSKLEVSAETAEQGEAHVELPIQYEGEPLNIAFNPAFLTDVLRVIPYEEVIFELQESFRPGVLSGEDKSDFLYVVMPVQL